MVGGGVWKKPCVSSLIGVWRAISRRWCWRLFGGGWRGMRVIVGWHILIR